MAQGTYYQPQIGSGILMTNEPCIPGRYTADEADELLGYGAYGAVWACTDPRNNKRVALKKLDNIFVNQLSCKRIFREIVMLASMQHENIVALLDMVLPEYPLYYNDLYILLDKMERDLHQIIASSQPLTVEHVKIFTYQLFRGLKYLHSANILHRDIKPGNLLVNSNCVLKICDFGLARLWDQRDTKRRMTVEVVTQYYKAPELLMGCTRYTSAIDIWSAGCVMAELLGRKILFFIKGPLEQLDAILDILGTPTPEELRDAPAGIREYIQRSAIRPPNIDRFFMIPQADRDAVDLLQRLLVFDSAKRLSAAAAVEHPYLDEGRRRFHMICSCCKYDPTTDTQYFTDDLEPCHKHPMDPNWENDLAMKTMQQMREYIYNFIECRVRNSNRLYINANAAVLNMMASHTATPQERVYPSP